VKAPQGQNHPFASTFSPKSKEEDDEGQDGKGLNEATGAPGHLLEAMEPPWNKKLFEVVVKE